MRDFTYRFIKLITKLSFLIIIVNFFTRREVQPRNLLSSRVIVRIPVPRVPCSNVHSNG